MPSIKEIREHCEIEGVDLVCDIDTKNADWLHKFKKRGN